jgi:hypothetical protein
MRKYFIVYEVITDEENNIIDIENKFDSDKLKDVAKWLDIDYTNINKYISKDINNINSRLKDNKYFIIKDYE